MAIIDFPILYFPDPSKGRPLFNGSVYVGNPNTDPVIAGNQKQLRVVQQDGTKVNITQPLTLSAGGVPVYQGSPVRLDVDGNFSIKVLDRLGAQAYYVENVFEGTPIIVEDLQQYIAAEFATVATMVSGTALNYPTTIDFAEYNGRQVRVTANNSTSKKGAATYTIKTAVQAAADGDVIDGTGAPNYLGRNHSVGGGTYVAINSEPEGWINLEDWGIKPGQDITSMIEDAVDQLNTLGGGQILIPRAAAGYKMSANFTGVRNNRVIIDLNENTITPQGSNYILFSDNTANSSVGTNLRIRNGLLDAALTSDYCARLIHTSGIEFDHVGFGRALIAGFHGQYAQYSEFYNSRFSNFVYDPATVACYVGGPNSGQRSNECIFESTKFFTANNGLVVAGGEKVRINNCRFQDHKAAGTAALRLRGDDSGAGSAAVNVTNNWFELNDSRDIYINVSESPVIDVNYFTGPNGSGTTPNKINSVESTSCYNINFLTNYFLTANAPVFAHPTANTDTAALIYKGSDINPNISGLVHNGKTFVNNERYESEHFHSRWSSKTTFNRPVINDKGIFNVNDVQVGVPKNVLKIVRTAGTVGAMTSYRIKIDMFNDVNVSTSIGWTSATKVVDIFTSYNSSLYRYLGQATATFTKASLNAATAEITDILLTVTPNGNDLDLSVDYTRAGSNAALTARCQAIVTVEAIGTEVVAYQQL